MVMMVRGLLLPSFYYLKFSGSEGIFPYINTMINTSIIFDFLKCCLGAKGDMSKVVAGMDWRLLYEFASKQAMLGVCFDGIERLGKEYPEVLRQNPIGRDVLMAWMAKAQQIRRLNMNVNGVAAKLYSMLKEDGLRCCILKGQGNALMYGNPYLRNPGDVDVWVNASREVIMEYGRRNFDLEDDIRYQHLETTMDGVPVELHFMPCVMNNPIYNARLQKWFRRNADLQCSNVVELPDGAGEIAVPTTAFNVVYQLCHLYHHFFDEGIGMRQMVDYYYVLVKSEEGRVKNCTATEGKANVTSLQRELKHLGLWKFAGAVMYVLHVVLGLSEEKMICPMDVKRGRVFLDEILAGGNFGHYDSRISFGTGAFGHNMQRLYRDLRLAWYYPAEALSEPIFRTWHFFWRMKNKK